MKHDWLLAGITFVGAIAVNVVIYAYGQGKLEHRVEALEQFRNELRAEWKEARERVERAIKESQPKEK